MPANAPSQSKILFDLADELSPEEIVEFEKSAQQAGAQSLTEHFLNLTLRMESETDSAA